MLTGRKLWNLQDSRKHADGHVSHLSHFFLLTLSPFLSLLGCLTLCPPVLTHQFTVCLLPFTQTDLLDQPHMIPTMRRHLFALCMEIIHWQMHTVVYWSMPSFNQHKYFISLHYTSFPFFLGEVYKSSALPFVILFSSAFIHIQRENEHWIVWHPTYCTNFTDGRQRQTGWRSISYYILFQWNLEVTKIPMHTKCVYWYTFWWD